MLDFGTVVFYFQGSENLTWGLDQSRIPCDVGFVGILSS